MLAPHTHRHHTSSHLITPQHSPPHAVIISRSLFSRSSFSLFFQLVAETPKYGLIYHASLVGQAAPKLKGKVSRMLAAKTALCIRMDALGEVEGVSIGLEGREKVESRLRLMEGGAAAKAAPTPKKGDQEKYRKPAVIRSYNAESDVAMDTNGATNGNGEAKVEATNGERKKEKKDKKRKVEEIAPAPLAAEAAGEDAKEGEQEQEKPKKKKKDKRKE